MYEVSILSSGGIAIVRETCQSALKAQRKVNEYLELLAGSDCQFQIIVSMLAN